MSELSYKGYIIEARPERLLENRQWSINIPIYKYRGSRLSEKPFVGSKTFQSEEEAIEHCFHFGKQIIDGQIENCKIDDL